jgi:hypothetical protein
MAQELDAQIMQNEQTADSLNFTMESLEILDAAKKAKDSEIADLRLQNGELQREVGRSQKAADQLTIQGRERNLRLRELEHIQQKMIQ